LVKPFFSPYLVLSLWLLIGCSKGGPIQPNSLNPLDTTLVVQQVIDLRSDSAGRTWQQQATRQIQRVVSRSGLFSNVEATKVQQTDLVLKTEILALKSQPIGSKTSLRLDGLANTAIFIGSAGLLSGHGGTVTQSSLAVTFGGVLLAMISRSIGTPTIITRAELKLSLIREGKVLWQQAVTKRYRTPLSSTMREWREKVELAAVEQITSSAITALTVDLPQLNLGSWHTGIQPPTPPVKQFVSDVDQGLPRSSTSRPFGMAVVIGNRTYTNQDIPDIDYAENDARSIQTYLTEILGYQEGNIFFLTNATKAQFEAHFGTAQDRSGKLSQAVIPNRSDVFVYYSGHGAPDLQNQRAYFVPADTDPTLVRQTGYGLDLLYRNLSEIPARSITIVIDACFSGSTHVGTLHQSASPLLIPELKIETSVQQKLTASGAIFTAAGADQISSWYPEQQHGLFTYFFLKGLQGEADLDQDQRISVADLSAYLTMPSIPDENVTYLARKLHGRRQTPEVKGNPNLILAELD